MHGLQPLPPRSSSTGSRDGHGSSRFGFKAAGRLALADGSSSTPASHLLMQAGGSASSSASQSVLLRRPRLRHGRMGAAPVPQELATFELDLSPRRAAQPRVHARQAGDAVMHGLRSLPQSVRQLLAGAAAGAVGKSVTAPLEVVKMQLAVQSNMTAWEAASAVVHRHGPAGFFRGNAVDVLRTSLSKSIELAMFERMKQTLRSWNKGREQRAHLPEAAVATVAGGVAGVISTALTFPLECARTRMAVATGCPTLSCHGLIDCLASMARKEGPASWYRGLDSSLIGAVPYTAIRLGMYDGMKRAYKKATKREHMDPKVALLCGALAGVVSSTLTFPLEVVRRRQMMGASYPHTLTALAAIARQEGPGALFNGAWLGLAKQAPQYAFSFATFEVCKQALRV